MDALTALLHQDVVMSMPPYALWLRGPEAVRDWMLGRGIGCRGSRLLPTAANGAPAFGQFRSSGPGLGFHAWGLVVLEVTGDRVTGINTFLDTERLFPRFGLPLRAAGLESAPGSVTERGVELERRAVADSEASGPPALAVEVGERRFRVAGAGDGPGRHGPLDRREVVRGERDLQRPERLVEPLTRPGADEGHDVLAA